MSVALNDVNIIAVRTADRDYQVGNTITVFVDAEAGSNLALTGALGQVRLTVTDTTLGNLVNSQVRPGAFGTPWWPQGQSHRTFEFTVNPATFPPPNRTWSILELQARVVASTGDASHAVSERILLTP